MSKLLMGLAVLSLSCAAFANTNAGANTSTGGTNATHTTVEAACATEATAANCGTDKGHALSKCIHAYQKANKSFNISDNCKNAMKHHTASN